MIVITPFSDVGITLSRPAVLPEITAACKGLFASFRGGSSKPKGESAL